MALGLHMCLSCHSRTPREVVSDALLLARQQHCHLLQQLVSAHLGRAARGSTQQHGAAQPRAPLASLSVSCCPCKHAPRLNFCGHFWHVVITPSLWACLLWCFLDRVRRGPGDGSAPPAPIMPILALPPYPGVLPPVWVTSSFVCALLCAGVLVRRRLFFRRRVTSEAAPLPLIPIPAEL